MSFHYKIIAFILMLTIGCVSSTKVQRDNVKTNTTSTTQPIDTTNQYTHVVSQSYPTVEEIVKQFADPTSPSNLSDVDVEIPYKDRVVRITKEETQAEAIIERCCALDDSAAGERVVLHMLKKQQAWVLQKTTTATICYRGATATHCL